MRQDPWYNVTHLVPGDRAGKYFKWSEYAGDHTVPRHQLNDAVRLIAVLDWCREQAGVPLLITSGYRPHDHNEKVKGAARYSQHCCARAADIRPVNSVPAGKANFIASSLHEQIKEHADALGVGGLGWYPADASGTQRSRIHVDIRPRPCGAPLARWTG